MSEQLTFVGHGQMGPILRVERSPRDAPQPVKEEPAAVAVVEAPSPEAPKEPAANWAPAGFVIQTQRGLLRCPSSAPHDGSLLICARPDSANASPLVLADRRRADVNEIAVRIRAEAEKASQGAAEEWAKAIRELEDFNGVAPLAEATLAEAKARHERIKLDPSSTTAMLDSAFASIGVAEGTLRRSVEEHNHLIAEERKARQKMDATIRESVTTAANTLHGDLMREREQLVETIVERCSPQLEGLRRVHALLGVNRQVICENVSTELLAKVQQG